MEYGGESNLAVMKLAKKYNRYLVDLVFNEVSESFPNGARGANVLDFGSGDGFFATKIGVKLNKEIVCVEPAKNMQKFYVNTPYADIRNVPDNFFDVIYSFNVLEHIKDDKKIIYEFKRVLKKGGKVILYLPAFNNLWSAMDDKVGHYRRYVKKDVKRLFGGEWNVKKKCYADFLGYFVTLMYKIVGNKSGKILGKQIVFFDRIVFPISKVIDKITFGRILGKNIIIVAELIDK